MKTRLYKLFISLVLIINFGTSQAIQVDDLYNAKILVEDKSQVEKKRAFSEALEEVLSRVALDKNMPLEAELKNQEHNQDKFINKYYYTQDGDNLYLNVEFDAKSIQGLFKEDYPNNSQNTAIINITLFIDGINDLQKLSTIEAYLNQLPYIKKLQIGELQGTRVAFNLDLSSDNKENLIKDISLYNALQPEDIPIEGSADQLYYRYE